MTSSLKMSTNKAHLARHLSTRHSKVTDLPCQVGVGINFAELSANLPKHRSTPHYWTPRLNWDTDTRPRRQVSGYFRKLKFFSVFGNFAYTQVLPCVRGRVLSDRRFTAKAFSTEIIGSKSTSFFIHIKNAAFRVYFNTK